MGAWSVSITGNDTAQDLKLEYQAAFFYNDAETAVEKIDAYVRTNMTNEEDEEEWCNYIYSLAHYMWKKGILTEGVKQQALHMIDTGFGLGIYAESGEKTLLARKKTLQTLRDQLCSPMPPRKKIRMSMYTKPIFADGDLVAFQLQTKDKPYVRHRERELSEEAFRALDGKYVLAQKIRDNISWVSAVEPCVKAHWAVFRLFDGVYEEVPCDVDVVALHDAKLSHWWDDISPLFCCESSMTYFRRRSYVVVGHDTADLERYRSTEPIHVFFGVNNNSHNADSDFAAAMHREMALEEYKGNLAGLSKVWFYANQAQWDSRKFPPIRKMQMEMRSKAVMQEALDAGKTFYCIHYGGWSNAQAILSVRGKELGDFYVRYAVQNRGYGTMLLTHAANLVGEGAYMDVPEEHQVLRHICRKAGFAESDGAAEGLIRMERHGFGMDR